MIWCLASLRHLVGMSKQTMLSLRHVFLAAFLHCKEESTYTPPETNTEPETGGLEDDVPVQKGDFQVQHVNFRDSTKKVKEKRTQKYRPTKTHNLFFNVCP